MATVSEYRKIPGGFDAVGGLEVAHSTSGVERLRSRQSKAAAPRSACSADERASGDAKANGAQFVEAEVRRLMIADGRTTGVELGDVSSSRQLIADVVILATGVWAQALLAREQQHQQQQHDHQIADGSPLPVVPVVPVGHPYLHGEPRPALGRKMPFVRWPEHHVYARDHGDRYGLGTYDHQPLECKLTNGTAIGDWVQGFDAPLTAATSLVPDEASKQLRAGVKFNGIFSMTPDNMPLAGAVQSIRGLYMAVAVWVTHAAGTAKFLTRVIDGIEGIDGDEAVRRALDPERFKGGDLATLEKASLEGYNEIYKTQETQL
ncbi:N,N-dimethylglycine oxidase [Verticillium dahliae VdLs.17]|uniref:N,N-dimethylglycine oxidase n=1 Tax=Verticillium dahliae (strain VdLs.17 / ATCC MYA-4575 / FGSC 10137) TaxID=498257 RepID=G2XGH4_VERDV|nr:N,N-dimethylglycine oxidase [Verticillium dahliae VdLs.17]EGY18922.1 N,N-dimethylglycine oxidase [Verticillium dahliae VdLs.17]